MLAAEKAGTALQAEPNPYPRADLVFRERRESIASREKPWAPPAPESLGAAGWLQQELAAVHLVAGGHRPRWAPKLVAGREVSFETMSKRRICMLLVLAWQSPPHPAHGCIGHGAVLLACAAWMGLTATSRPHGETAGSPAPSVVLPQWCISFFPVLQKAWLDLVESQYISLIYLPNTTLSFNPVLPDICISCSV